MRKAKWAVSDFLVFSRWKPQKPPVQFSGNTLNQCNDLKGKGIIRLDRSYVNFANYLLDEYVNKQSSTHDFVDTSDLRSGNTINYHLSLTDPRIVAFVLDPFLIDLLHCYYGKEPVLRNDPLLQGIAANEHTLEMTNSMFHIDRYNQLSLMLLLNDTTIQSTHMEYLCKTHTRKFGFWNLYLRDPAVPCSYLDFVERSSEASEPFKLVGSKGDVFVFDTMGLHRANYILKSKRLIFHLNFTNGHNLYRYSNKISAYPDFSYSSNASPTRQEIILRQNGGLVFSEGDRHTYFSRKIFDLGRW